jgi:hypothetical protein
MGDALFPVEAVPAAAVPAPVAGGAAAALEEALRDGQLARQYPAGVALARAVMRAVDVADVDRKASVMAQLVRPAVEVLRPLGLMPADVEAVEAGEVTGVSTGEGARVFELVSAATMVHPA